MKRIFPETHVELCPDIVLSLNGWVSSKEREGIGFCIRDDKESVISSKQIARVIKQITSCDTKIRKFDTMAEAEQPIVGEYRERLVLEKLMEFAACEMVVTDRLHGMIFSYITSTPCVAMANSTGKSFYAYNDWLSRSENVAFVQDLESDIVKPKYVKSQDLDFSSLKDALLYGVGE